ncbi:MAG: phosphohistidine phosphatase SixA [Syntrophaceae bacterium]
MALYLVQHGLSLAKEVDSERGLSDEGRVEVERIAGVAKGYGIMVATIMHSGKKRARQTAEIMAASLNPAQGVIPSSGMDPMDDVEPWVKKLDSMEDLMLVGHLPFLERLVSRLITGKPEPLVFKLQNGGILCLDKLSGTWVIRWALMPHIG